MQTTVNILPVRLKNDSRRDWLLAAPDGTGWINAVKRERMDRSFSPGV